MDCLWPSLGGTTDADVGGRQNAHSRYGERGRCLSLALHTNSRVVAYCDDQFCGYPSSSRRRRRDLAASLGTPFGGQRVGFALQAIEIGMLLCVVCVVCWWKCVLAEG